MATLSLARDGTRWNAVHRILHIYITPHPNDSCNGQTRVPLRSKEPFFLPSHDLFLRPEIEPRPLQKKFCRSLAPPAGSPAGHVDAQDWPPIRWASGGPPVPLRARVLGATDRSARSVPSATQESDWNRATLVGHIFCAPMLDQHEPVLVKSLRRNAKRKGACGG